MTLIDPELPSIAFLIVDKIQSLVAGGQEEASADRQEYQTRLTGSQLLCRPPPAY
jgi:hypothetical protein